MSASLRWPGMGANCIAGMGGTLPQPRAGAPKAVEIRRALQGRHSNRWFCRLRECPRKETYFVMTGPCNPNCIALNTRRPAPLPTPPTQM
jgi:hypothetical protein